MFYEKKDKLISTQYSVKASSQVNTVPWWIYGIDHKIFKSRNYLLHSFVVHEWFYKSLLTMDLRICAWLWFDIEQSYCVICAFIKNNKSVTYIKHELIMQLYGSIRVAHLRLINIFISLISKAYGLAFK